MRRIFIDLEMQPITDKKLRLGCRSEIIEIGAVMLDEDQQEVSSFCEYIKPMYSRRLTTTIINLTGITDGMLAGARTLPEALTRFTAWALQSGPEVEVYAWSPSDLCQMKAEIRRKKFPVTPALAHLLCHWYDFQKAFDNLLHAPCAYSLENALTLSGIPFEGKMHDALFDARNTAELYRATRDQDAYLANVNQIKEETTADKAPSLSIAELVNLDALKI